MAEHPDYLSKMTRDELLMVVAEAYQVVGCLADHAGLFDDPNVIRALDRFSGRVKEEILPWPATPLPPLPLVGVSG